MPGQDKISGVISGLALCLALAGCGGAKLLQEPVAFTPQAPLATSADAHLEVILHWVIVRDGPGTWARNADWDEYLVAVRNRSGGTVSITSASVYDSLGTRIRADDDRGRLVKASRATSRRYEGQGVVVKAGVSEKTLLTAATVAAGAASAGASTIYMSSAAAAGALAGLVLAPVLAVGGLVKSANQKKVADEIQRRHTDLPVEIATGDSREFDLFFALGPSPRYVELSYVDDAGEHVLRIDTRAALDGLHIAP